jgi:hypothetical protein
VVLGWPWSRIAAPAIAEGRFKWQNVPIVKQTRKGEEPQPGR